MFFTKFSSLTRKRLYPNLPNEGVLRQDREIKVKK